MKLHCPVISSAGDEREIGGKQKKKEETCVDRSVGDV